jgi:pimeloyl-ACP methyl ester carboxylesterase
MQWPYSTRWDGSKRSSSDTHGVASSRSVSRPIAPIVGDGGLAAFEAEMGARTPRKDRDRQRQLDDRAMAGEGTAEDLLESLRLVWPAYFADPDNVPPMPPIRASVEAYSGVINEVTADADRVAAALAAADVHYGVLAGGASPMPWGQAARATVELSPHAFLKVVPAAGHFPWLDEPGCVRAALNRLAGLTSTL